jgi:hypothetical protein
MMNIVKHLERQAVWSNRTFGPGKRLHSITEHIIKEVAEIRESDGDITEWIDVVILGLDGAWRTGATPQEVIDALVAKQTKNEGRKWPDWREVDPDKAMEHEKFGVEGYLELEAKIKSLKTSMDALCDKLNDISVELTFEDWDWLVRQPAQRRL